MIPDFTLAQLQQLAIDKARPLLICDVDEVVVHFTTALESYLLARDLWLDPASLALNGNIRHRTSNRPLADKAVGELIDDFFHRHTHELDSIDGAAEALQDLATVATVIMLTNLPHHARENRIVNLAGHGLHFPVVTNSGPKGPAIRHLATQTERPVVFVDDSPNFIHSAGEHAPFVHRIHFVQDSRFAAHMEHIPGVSLRTARWAEALPHIRQLFAN
jgi:FMN phosphatase YigB (HAD superfamily)